jgi:hypothetical protein
MEIIVEIKTVYGNETIYPKCEQAKGFASIAGTKTLTRSVISTVKKMGYAVVAEVHGVRVVGLFDN